VAAERVVVGGIHGFFGKQRYEVTVEVSDGTGEPRMDLPRRIGIAALLDDADAAESRANTPNPPSVSTRSGDFAELMDRLVYEVGPGEEEDGEQDGQEAFAPAPRSGPGDLVLIVGIGASALRVARSMAALTGGAVAYGGAARGETGERVADRRTALALRARGVNSGHSAFVAFILPGIAVEGPEYEECVRALRGIGPDQTWLAVDAGCKPEDTVHWTRAVRSVVEVDAVAVEGTSLTLTPTSPAELELPIGWVDGGPPR